MAGREDFTGEEWQQRMDDLAEGLAWLHAPNEVKYPLLAYCGLFDEPKKRKRHPNDKPIIAKK